jgi:hydroxymethylbilane synthase
MRLPLTIGTRGSPLALAQAAEVWQYLARFDHRLAAPNAVKIEVIQTSGDRFLERSLSDIGGKGLFTKEIEEALLCGAIDIAVHSMKDLPTILPDGLVIGAVLPREDPRDAMMSPIANTITALPQGAKVGSASLRRRAQLLHLRPDLRVELLRGNVQTRLRKLEEGDFAATLLAVAGLKRLSLMDKSSAILSTDVMLPAVAQGAIGVECLANNDAVMALLDAANHTPTAICVQAERAMLRVLDGSCRTPIAALAVIDDATGLLRLDGLVATPDGKRIKRLQLDSTPDQARQLGKELGKALRNRIGECFFFAPTHLPD